MGLEADFMISIALFLALQTAPVDNTPQPDDIVVTAVRDTCTLRFADKTMTDAQFDARTAEWKAGRPVRMILRSDAAFPCVPDPKLPRYTAPAGAPNSMTGTSGGSGGWSEMRAREHSFLGRSASQLILQGKCAEARKMALEQGDLDAAAAIVEVCRAQGQ